MLVKGAPEVIPLAPNKQGESPGQHFIIPPLSTPIISHALCFCPLLQYNSVNISSSVTQAFVDPGYKEITHLHDIWADQTVTTRD